MSQRGRRVASETPGDATEPTEVRMASKTLFVFVISRLDATSTRRGRIDAYKPLCVAYNVSTFAKRCPLERRCCALSDWRTSTVVHCLGCGPVRLRSHSQVPGLCGRANVTTSSVEGLTFTHCLLAEKTSSDPWSVRVKMSAFLCITAGIVTASAASARIRKTVAKRAARPTRSY